MCLAGQGIKEIKGKDFVLPTCTQKSIKPPSCTLFCQKPPRQDMIGIYCKLILGSKMIKRKEKMKHKTLPPPMCVSRPNVWKRERMSSSKQKCKNKNKLASKNSLILSSHLLSANPPLNQPKIQNTSKGRSRARK